MKGSVVLEPQSTARDPARGNGSRPRVVYWNNQPSPYFVRRMNALHERGNIAIEAWFSELREPDRDWLVDPEQWCFESRILPRGPRRAARAIRLLRSERPDVLVSLYGDYAFASVALTAKVQRTPVVIHAMRMFSAWRPRSLVRETAKQALFRIADGVQACGPDSSAYAERYGAEPARVFAIREEIDLPFWTQANDACEAERRALRAAHGLSGCIFLYVGHLCRDKGIGSLIDAYAGLRAAGVDCSLVLVGTGVDEERIRARAQRLDRVAFPGFVEGRELRAWYSVADVFVFPTLGDSYGHVVQEAMASGLPVVTSTAAGDIRDRVVEGRTGYLVPPDDVPSVAQRMRLLAEDPELRSRLGASGKERVKDWSTQLWAKRFEDMIFAVLRSRSGR